MPIYKSEDNKNFNNYRPISLLSSFSKLLEKRAQKLGITFQELRIMEAGMFISAAPLHPENSRYIALLLKAIEVYRDCISR